MLHTKNYYFNPTSTYARGMESFSDLGYSLSIPWGDITTAGWANTEKQAPIKMWGTENKLLIRDDPEYYAPDDLIRSNVIPAINIHDPIFKFSRADYTYSVW